MKSEVIKKVRVLHRFASRDLANRLWATTDDHVQTYNSLVLQVTRFPGCHDLVALAPLAKWQRGRGEKPSRAEKVKLAEVVRKSSILLERLLVRLPGNQRKPRSDLRLDRIFDRFHLIVAQLGINRGGRRSSWIRNEYDVQRLLHALLLLEFDDVRPEEWTPSYAGGAARMDFLVPTEGIVIETKMTRTGLGDRKLGDQLLIDIAKYEEHPKCRTLYCFVYDPGKKVKNPRGLEDDLMRRAARKLKVVVVIRPRGI